MPCVAIFDGDGSKKSPHSMTTGSAPQLTLMAVHAHPDDESTSTGGILAHYARHGVRTVVVTCTGGELGDGPGGVKPGADGHDPHEVAAIRRGELRRACAHLRVAHLAVHADPRLMFRARLAR